MYKERERESDYLSLFLMAKMELQASGKEEEREREEEKLCRIARKQPKASLSTWPCLGNRGLYPFASLSCCRKKNNCNLTSRSIGSCQKHVAEKKCMYPS